MSIDTRGTPDAGNGASLSAPDLRVTPEPTDAELAAIVAVVHLRQRPEVNRDAVAPDRRESQRSTGASRWARAGRLDSMRGLLDDAI